MYTTSLYTRDDIGVILFEDRRPISWGIYDKNHEYLGRDLVLARHWTPRSILKTINKAGIDVPKGKNIVTIQNDLADDVIYVQLLGQDWLILKLRII